MGKERRPLRNCVTMSSKTTEENATIIRAISQGNNARHFARRGHSHRQKFVRKKREL